MSNSSDYYAGAHSAMLRCIKVLTTDGIVKFVNPQGLQLLEAECEEQLVGHRYIEIWPDDQKPTIALALQQALSGDIPIFEAYCPTFRQSPRWWETSFYVLKRQSVSEIEIIGVSRDISLYRKQALEFRLAEDEERRTQNQLGQRSATK